MIGLHGHQAPQKCHIRVSCFQPLFSTPYLLKYPLGPPSVTPFWLSPIFKKACSIASA